MVTLYTSDKQVEITYQNGDTVPYSNIAGIAYHPGMLLIIWNDYTTKQVENPADSYKHIACPGRFDIDIE